MSRHENEDISSLDIPTSDLIITYYYSDGTSGVDEKKGKTFAKFLFNEETNFKKYYALVEGSNLFDPFFSDIRRNAMRNWKWRSISQKAFDLYIFFLSSRRKAVLYQAEREL